MFFDNAYGLVGVLVVGPLAYVWLIAVLRCSGKRTLAQLNAFDFIVTVALGSTLATVALSSSVALQRAPRPAVVQADFGPGPRRVPAPLQGPRHCCWPTEPVAASDPFIVGSTAGGTWMATSHRYTAVGWLTAGLDRRR